jgi:AAA15 family ATPase/GTPase
VEENLTELETSMYNMLESELDYFYVERVDYNSNVVLRIENTHYFYQQREKLEYSYDKITWNKVKDGDYNFSYRIYFRCVGDSITTKTGYTRLFDFPAITTKFNIGGNLDMLMYNYKNVASGNYTLTNTCYCELFKGLRIHHAKDLRLPSMNLDDACY